MSDSDIVELSLDYEVKPFRPKPYLPEDDIDLPEIVEGSNETYTEFFNYARARELISGFQWSIVMRLQTGAHEEFPGGVMTNIQLKQYAGQLSTITRNIKDNPISDFKGSKEISFSLGIPEVPGIAELRFSLVTNGSENVKLSIMGDEQIKQPFQLSMRVLDREQIRILNQIIKIRQKLAGKQENERQRI